MNCPKCDTIVPAEDVNIQALVAKCRRCHEVFRVTDVLPATDDKTSAGKPVRVPQPATLMVQEEGDIRVMRRRWFRPVYLFLLFFCIAWDSFLVFWYSMGILGGGPGGGMAWLFFVFPIAHVAVGVGLTYFVVAGFLNKSYVGVTPDRLYVRHGPVPWPGTRDLPTGAVKEVYVEQCSYTQTRHNQPVQYQYNLNAVTDDGKTRKLLGGLELPEAHYAAQTLNDWLNLTPSRLGVRVPS